VKLLAANPLRGMRGQALAAVMLKAFGVAAAMLLQWLVARSYGATGQGLFGLMATTVALTAVVGIFGQDYLALRNIAGDLAENKPESARAHAQASIRIALIGSAIATAVVAMTALVYYEVLDSAPTALILLAALPACAALAIGRVFSFIARAGGNIFKSQLVDGPITSGVGVLLVAALWLLPERPPVWALGIAYSLSYLAALTLGLTIGRRALAKWPRPKRTAPTRPLLVSGVSRVVGYASPFLSDWSIVFTMTAIWGAAAAGVVRVPTLFLNAMFLIAIAFDAVFAPKMAATLRLADRESLKRLYRNYVIGSLGLNVPVVLALTLAPELVLGLFGPEFVVAAPALRLGALAMALTVAMGPAGLVLVMSHNERLTYISNGFGLIVLVLGCWFAIPRFGIPGGILTFAAVQLGKRIMEFALVRAKLGMPVLV
jgi:O-antigen/teichoic acid export membrane protein